MKQTATRFKHLILIMLFCALTVAQNSANAQSITTAAIPDITRYTCRPCTVSPTSVATLNADMIELDALSGNHRVFAFAWSDAVTASVPNGFFISSTVPSAGIDFAVIGHVLPNPPSNIDLAFGSYEVNDTMRYKLMFAFESAGNIYVQLYSVSRAITTHNIVSLEQTVKVTSSGNAHNPHIDMLVDNGAGYSTSDPMQQHTAVITWHEQNCLGTNEIFATTCEISTLNSTTNFPAIKISASGLYPDVAAVADEPGTGSSISSRAFITYIDTGRTKLYVTQWNLATNSLTTTTLESGANRVYFPRIEGKAFSNAGTSYGSTGDSRWHVVASVKPTSMSNIKVREYNESSTPLNNISDNLNTTDDYLMPVVTGVGDVPTASSNLGNDSFAIMFYGDYNFNSRNEDMYAGYIDADNATFAGTQFYEVNNTALSTSFSMAGTKPTLAIATSTNTGKDMFAVWYNGSDIKYKYIPSNSPSFKPADITGLNMQNVKISPNPARTELVIEGGTGMGYSVSNMAGQEVLKGTVDGSAIDINSLMPGAHIITLSSGTGETKSMKFVKE